MRGMAVIEIIRKLEFESGVALRDMLDLVVDVSTGSFLSGLLTLGGCTLPQAAELYEDMRVRMGSVPHLVQQLKRFTVGHSHSTPEARQFMQDAFGDGPMLQSDGAHNGPMFAAVATNVDVDPAQPHLFRSYKLSPEAQKRSLLRGSSDTKLWAGVCASTSAPTYYEPEVIDGVRYNDGGVTANNPSLLAVSEAHALWPGTPIDPVVSIGTGEPAKRKKGPLGSVLDWMHVVFMTSLGSHMQHYLAHSLLPQGVYFRMDPADIGEVLMSESDEGKLSDMIQLTQLWCHSNHDRFAAIADIVNPNRARHGQPAPAVWPPESDFMQRVARVAGAEPLRVRPPQQRVAQHVSTGGRHSGAHRAERILQQPSGSSESSTPVAQADSGSSADEGPVGPHEHSTYQMRPAALAVAAVAAMAAGGEAEHSESESPEHDTPTYGASSPAAGGGAGYAGGVLQGSLALFAPPHTPSAAPQNAHSPAAEPPSHPLGVLSREMGLKEPL